MKYTEYCPNCDQQMFVEEDPTLPYGYVIKNNKGDVIERCPNCRRELTIIDGVMSVAKNED